MEVSDLSEAQKQQLATWLKTTYLNTVFLGQAEFRRRDDSSCG